MQFSRVVLLQRRVQITGLRDRTLEQETDHIVLRLSHQLNDLRRQKVPVLLEEALSLINHATGEVMNCEAHRVRFWSYVEFGFNVVVEFFCWRNRTRLKIYKY